MQLFCHAARVREVHARVHYGSWMCYYIGLLHQLCMHGTCARSRHGSHRTGIWCESSNTGVAVVDVMKSASGIPWRALCCLWYSMTWPCYPSNTTCRTSIASRGKNCSLSNVNSNGSKTAEIIKKVILLRHHSAWMTTWCCAKGSIADITQRIALSYASYFLYFTIDWGRGYITQHHVYIQAMWWRDNMTKMTAAVILKKTVKSPYLCNRLTDFDEIRQGNAHWPFTVDIKCRIFENPWWRRPKAWKSQKKSQ